MIAEISTDGSFGARQNLSADQGIYTINQQLGRISGGNLFHSFQHFNINQGETAVFQAETALSNVISRVTGGQVSNLNGILRSEIAQADFYFINPAGIVIGESAQIDVPAGFYLSTASALNFADGVSFRADNPDASSLSVAQPEGLSFTPNQAGQISIQNGRLVFKPETDVAISANQIQIDNSLIRSDLNNSNEIKGISLTIEAYSPDQSHEVSFDHQQSVQGGSIIINSSTLDTSGNGFAKLELSAASVDAVNSLLFADNTGQLSMSQNDGVHLRADNFSLTSSILSSNSLNQGDSGPVRIQVSDMMSLADRSLIRSSVFDSGNAGVVELDIGSLTLDGLGNPDVATEIASNVLQGSTGNAGDVLVNAAADINLRNGGIIRSSTLSSGSGGRVQVRAQNLLVDAQGLFAGIFSDTLANGQAGDIQLDIAQQIQIQNAAVISSTARSGSGDAGNINLNAASLEMDGMGVSTGVSSGSLFDSSGNAGDISLQLVNEVHLLNSAQISSDSAGLGDAGDITLSADQMIIDAQGGNFFQTGLSSDTIGTGNAGNIEVNLSSRLELIDGGLISSENFNQGVAGNIDVSADSILLDGNNNIVFPTAISSDTSGLGDAGTVTVIADRDLQLINGGQLSSTTFSESAAGTVNVQADSVLIDAQGNLLTGIFTNSNFGSGPAGTVNIQVGQQLTLLNQGTINSSTNNTGNAGNIRINAGNLTVDGQGVFETSINSDTFGSGDAGDIDIQVDGQLQILNAGKISSNSFNLGDAGNIVVQANDIQLKADPEDSFFTFIGSLAGQNSSGRVGNIQLTATNAIDFDLAGVTISSFNPLLSTDSALGTDQPLIHITTPKLSLQRNSGIAATAEGGVDAARIELEVADFLDLRESQISTSAFNGNGGEVNLDVSGYTRLSNSQITTSVRGADNGNGGNIGLFSSVLILDTGFIQANTVADSAFGGDINLNVSQFIASANQIFIGGVEPLEFDSFRENFNVIQATSPTGVNGNIVISSPELNIVGDLVNIQLPDLNLEAIGEDPCSRQSQNSLKRQGKGGAPVFQQGENYSLNDNFKQPSSAFKSAQPNQEKLSEKETTGCDQS